MASSHRASVPATQRSRRSAAEHDSKGSETPSERVRWGIADLDLGISLGGASSHAHWKTMLAWVERAEELGLHSAWIPEAHFAPAASSAPLLTLAAYAARTKRLRLATTSLLLPIHPPRRVAREVAALDRLCAGRVILGLGRGFRAPLFAAFGVDPAAKRDRFDRSLDRILATWAEAAAPWSRPLQRPHPPLAVAAFGRKGLEQAARRDLPYLASPLEPLEILAENLAYHREQRARHARQSATAGAEPAVPIMRTVFVARSDAATARVLDGLRALERPFAGRLPAPLARATATPLERRVVVGSAAFVSDELARHREQLGMNLLIVRPALPGATPAEAEDSLVRLAGEVLPAIAGATPGSRRAAVISET